MRDSFNKALTLILALTALSVAGGVVIQTVLPSGMPGAEAAIVRKLDKNDWKDALDVAVHMAGNRTAPITILALVDLECPPCREFHDAALDLVSLHSNHLQLLYVHFPLSYHKHAVAAARGAECARDFGDEAYVRWMAAVFANQDSLGLRPWLRYALDAGIPNAKQMENCIADRRQEARIAAGLELGQRLRVTGTPTVIVNGWHHVNAPSRSQLQLMIDSLLMAHSSFKAR